MLYRRLAFAFGVAISLLQAGRAILWWQWPRSLSEWPIFLDAYLVGAFLIVGAVIAGRKDMVGRLIIAAGWGFSCGILFRSFFEQLADPTRRGGHETLVLASKGALLAFSVTGLAIAVQHEKKTPNQSLQPTGPSARG